MNLPRSALVAAWLTAMGWIGYRDIKQGQAPNPRPLIRGSALYGLLGLAAPLITDPVAAALGWGVLAAQILSDSAPAPAGETGAPTGSPPVAGGAGGKASVL